MADQRLVTFEGKTQAFPADATDAEISAALNAIPAANASQVPKAKTWVDTAVDAIPAIAGTAGAVIGGAGGTVAGFGVGGVPGAAGGAAVGTAGGEALKQLINYARGAETPKTEGDMAKEIAVPAAIAGGTTAVLGGLGSFLAPKAGQAMVKGGKVLAESPSWRQLAGEVMQDVGEKITPKQAATKLNLSALDVMRIQTLKKAGMAEADAVKKVIEMRLSQAVQAASRMK